MINRYSIFFVLLSSATPGATVMAQSAAAPGTVRQTPDGGSPDDGESSGNELPVNDLIIRQWVSRAGGGSKARADAIGALTRLKVWDRVDQLLAATKLGEIPTQQQAEMADRIGATNFLRIRQSEQVSDQAKSVLDAIGKAAQMTATADASLQAAMKQFVSEQADTDQKLAAARTLVGGGNASIVAVTNALVGVGKEKGPMKNDVRKQLLRLLLSFGDHALDPLEQMALYGHPEQRLNALASLRMLNRERFLTTWLTALHARDSTAEEQRVSSQAIGRFEPSRITFHEAHQYLHEDLMRQFAAVRQLEKKFDVIVKQDRSFQAEKTWSLARDGKTITQARLTPLEKSYRDVVDAASRLKRLGKLSPDIAFDVFAAEIGYQIAIDPDWLFDLTPNDLVADVPDVKPLSGWNNIMRSAKQLRVLTQTPDDPNLQQWLGRALAHADYKQNEAATLGIIRFLTESMRVSDTEDQRTLMREALLSPAALGAHSSLPALVELAASSPRNRIRYEAALLVAKMMGDDRYAGKTRVRQTFAEMSRLTEQPIVVLVETRSGVRTDIERLVVEMGMQLEIVPSAFELQRLVNRGGDIRVIVAKSNLRDLRPIELLDLIRRMPRGQHLPIVFYPADQVEWNLPFEARWDAPVVKLDGPVTRAAIEEAIAFSQRTPVIAPLTGLERRGFRTIASEQLEIR